MMFIFARIVIKNILLEYTSESFDSLFLIWEKIRRYDRKVLKEDEINEILINASTIRVKKDFRAL